jgi:hypothetical protein
MEEFYEKVQTARDKPICVGKHPGLGAADNPS